MRVIVVGCGRLGAELAHRLFQHGHQVIVVDHNPEAFGNLHHDFRGKTIEGSGIAQSVLLRAGIKDADGVAAVTNSDVENAIVGHIAKVEYQIEKIVVRNCDLRWQAMHEAFGLQTVSSTLWGVERVEELLHHSCLQLVYSNTQSDINLFELVVSHAHLVKTIHEALRSTKCSVVSATRGDSRFTYSDNLPLMVGDVLHINTDKVGAEKLRAQLRLPDA